jgi:hypothetical protein
VLTSANFCDEGMHDLDIAICKLENDVVAIFNVFSMAEEILNVQKETTSIVIVIHIKHYRKDLGLVWI